MVVVAIYVGFIGFKSVQMGVTCKWGWKRVAAINYPGVPLTEYITGTCIEYSILLILRPLFFLSSPPPPNIFHLYCLSNLEEYLSFYFLFRSLDRRSSEIIYELYDI